MSYKSINSFVNYLRKTAFGRPETHSSKLTIEGIAACMSRIESHLQKWQRTNTPAPTVQPINDPEHVSEQVKIYTISILASIFPEETNV